MPDLQKTITITRWMARIIGLLLVGFILLIVIGEILSDTPPPTAEEMTAPVILLFFALFMMTIGVLVGWLREGWGGALALGGATLFILVNSISSREFRVGPVEPAFAWVGILYLVCWYFSRPQDTDT